MNVSRILLAFVLAGFAASVAMADGADPLVSVRKVDPAPIAITSPNQTFFISLVVDPGQTGLFALQNDTGVTLTSLTLDLAANLTFTCEPDFLTFDIFSSCNASPGLGPLGSTVVAFSGTGGIFTGLTASSCTGSNPNPWDNNGPDGDGDFDDRTCTGGIFSIAFYNNSNTTPHPVTDRIFGFGTVGVPEPMTATLLVSGLVGLAGLRKRRIA